MRNEPDAARRSVTLARWFDLTRRVLPAMAARETWPIRADHCLMRVCLDVSLGQAWPAVVRPPAYRHLSETQLAAAVKVAEGIVLAPGTLARLNVDSLRLREAWRAAGSPKVRRCVTQRAVARTGRGGAFPRSGRDNGS